MMLVSSLQDTTVKELYQQNINKLTDESGIVSTMATTDRFVFSGPIGRWAWNGFNPFNLVSKAEFTFKKPQHVLFLEYKLNFGEILSIVLIFTPLPVIAYILGFNHWAIGFALGLWAGIYGGGVLYTIWRLNKWIMKQLDLFEKHVAENLGDLPVAHATQEEKL